MRSFAYKLNRPITYDDVEFVSASGVPYDVEDKSLLGSNDSGWCDAGTGYRLITPTMRLLFDLSDPEHRTLIHAKYFGEIQVVF